MQFAHIVPSAYLPVASPYLGTFHLVEAPVVLGDPSYAAFYRERAEVGDYVIVDNGAFAGGQAVSDEDLLRAAAIVNAAEIVLPDVLFDAGQTLFRRDTFFGKMTVNPSVKVMGVPQGGTPKDFEDCFHSFLLDDRIHCLAFPFLSGQRVYPQFPDRAGWMAYLFDRFSLKNATKAFHVLGVLPPTPPGAPKSWLYGWREIATLPQLFPSLRSQDSGFAAACAFQGIGLVKGDPDKGYVIVNGPGSTFFQEAYNPGTALLVIQNLKFLTGCLRSV